MAFGKAADVESGKKKSINPPLKTKGAVKGTRKKQKNVVPTGFFVALLMKYRTSLHVGFHETLVPRFCCTRSKVAPAAGCWAVAHL